MGSSLLGSMTPEFRIRRLFPSDFSGDSPATTIACIAMEFSTIRVLDLEERLTSGQQVSSWFFAFLFLLSDEIATETGI